MNCGLCSEWIELIGSEPLRRHLESAEHVSRRPLLQWFCRDCGFFDDSFDDLLLHCTRKVRVGSSLKHSNLGFT